MKILKTEAQVKIKSQWLELTGKPILNWMGLYEIVSRLEERANSGDTINYEINSFFTLSHRPEHIELYAEDFIENKID